MQKLSLRNGCTVCIGISIKWEWSGGPVYEDSEGQILIIKGTLCGIVWTIVGIYAP